MNPVYQIRAQLDILSSMASKWPPFGTKLGILPLAPKCTQHTKFQTIWTIGIDFGIWGIFVLVGKLLMHIPLLLHPASGPKLEFQHDLLMKLFTNVVVKYVTGQFRGN